MAVLDDIKFGDSEAGAGAPIRLVFHLVDDARTTSVLVGLPVVEYGTSHVVRSGGRSIQGLLRGRFDVAADGRVTLSWWQRCGAGSKEERDVSEETHVDL